MVFIGMSHLKTVESRTSSDVDGNPVDIFVDNGGRQLPALGLLHEMGHAYELLNNRKAQRKRSRSKNEAYDNQEEKYIIERYETPAAKILKESTRNNHGGLPYTTRSSTSREH